MQRAGLVLRRSLSTKTPTKLKGHAPRVVAHVVGPDRVGILSEVNRIIAAHGGKVHDTRVATLGGTFAVTTEIEVDSDSSAISAATALQQRQRLLKFTSLTKCGHIHPT